MDADALAVRRRRRRRRAVAHTRSVALTAVEGGSGTTLRTPQAARNDPATFAKLEELLLNRERPLHQRFRALFTLKNLKGPLAVEVGWLRSVGTMPPQRPARAG